MSNNIIIAKNTIVLYLRMVVVMFVSLYTSRIILDEIGIEDYGIYNVVGGFVLLFSFLNSALGQSTQRMISYEIGREKLKTVNTIFSMTINAHLLVAIMTFLLAETLGLWFVNYKLNVPIYRIRATNWVYQFSIISIIISIIQVPYTALIFAYEKLRVYSYLSMIEVLLKLIMVYILMNSVIDKLILYSFLITFSSIIIFFCYRFYCLKKITDCNYRYVWNSEIFIMIFNYTTWSMFGNLAGVATNQGVNIVLNIFFGTNINTSRGIALQVKHAITTLVYNYQAAAGPRIIKSFAGGEKDYMVNLIILTSRLSYLMLLFIAIPFLFKMPEILNLWLNKVPEFTLIFCRLAIVNVLIDCMAGTLQTAIQATGKIKLYQLSVGMTQLMNLPIVYLLLKKGYPPQVTLIVSCIFSFFSAIIQIYIVDRLLDIDFLSYLNVVIKNNIIVTGASLIVNFLMQDYLKNLNDILMFLLIGVVNTLIIYIFGLKKKEKKWIIAKIIKLRFIL